MNTGELLLGIGNKFWISIAVGSNLLAGILLPGKGLSTGMPLIVVRVCGSKISFGQMVWLAAATVWQPSEMVAKPESKNPEKSPFRSATVGTWEKPVLVKLF